MTNEQLWQATLGELELTLSKVHFITWFKNSFISSYDNKKMIVGVPNAFTKTWLEKKYHDAILKILKNLTQDDIVEIIYKVEMHRPVATEPAAAKTSAKTKAAPDIPLPHSCAIKLNDLGLNSRYTFDTFIIGKTNELAHAAAQTIAKSPGQTYNPLYVYGGVGLGKTHLLQAIGHEISRQTRKVLYVTCEQFTNEYIQAVKQGQAKQFKDRYRSVDLLMLDDVQFIGGKEATQEELFHTFNTLHQENKQIVLTSDRPPKDIFRLEDRLKSRFEWGLIADISQPDTETRIAILEAKCKAKNYDIPQEVVHFLAEEICSNIRELEGALNRLIGHQQFHDKPVTLEMAQNILKKEAGSISSTGKALTPKQLLKAVAEYFDIAINDLIGKSRRKELVVPRQIVMYLMREELSTSYPTIGYELGKRDHTTAMHAYNKIRKNFASNDKLKQDIDGIRKNLSV